MSEMSDEVTELGLSVTEWVHIMVSLDKHIAYCEEQAQSTRNADNRTFWEDKSAKLGAVMEKIQNRREA